MKLQATDFFTREAGNNGIEMKLRSPSTGEMTDEYLLIGSIHCDAFRAADAMTKRSAVELAQIEDEVKRGEAIEKAVLMTICSLVLDWSFAAPCTPEAVFKLLTEAPQLQDQINQLAGRVALFTKPKSSGSTTGLKPSATSTQELQKTPKLQKEHTTNKSKAQQVKHRAD